MQKYLDQFCKCDKCKHSTYKNYALSLSYLDKNNVDWSDLDTALTFLQEQSLSRRLACLSALKTYHRDVSQDMSLFNKISEPLRDVHNLRRKTRQSQTRSPTQEKNWVDLKCLRKEVKQLTQSIFSFDKHAVWSKDEYQQAQLALFMGYMCANPCRRDLCTLSYTKKTGNYVDSDKRAFIFNDYKTKKYHGEITVPLKRDLWKLYSWIRSQHRLLYIEDGHLFRNKYMRPMTRGALGAWLKSMCKCCLKCCCEKDVTCNLLRHLVCSKEYENQPLLLQKQQNAKMRMHTAKTSEEYRVL